MFSAQIVSFGISLLLPAVGISLYMWKIEENAAEMKDSEQNLSIQEIQPKFSWDKARKLLWNHFIVSYSNRTVLIWSIWWALTTAGYIQIISYVQLLWQQIDPNQENFYNGGVEAALTLFGALSASLVRCLILLTLIRNFKNKFYLIFLGWSHLSRFIPKI